MKTYQVVLTKSYVVTVNAETKEKAKRFAEFYTGDIQDISTDENRRKLNFSIEEIDTRINESLEAEEIKND
ncbi:MAG: hypothetical protein Q8O30_04105 [Candidatus Omnitrophota bacterium]|nr:hypothetical protein [Candidatus Omnitrophota bacterium]